MKDSFTATLLAKKAEIYAELTKEDVLPLRTVDFRLSNAHNGWVEMTVLLDDKPVAEVRFSYCCGPDPIAGLLNWAEQIVSEAQVPQLMFYFGEGTDYQFYFENICYDVTGVVTGPSVEASVFSLEVLPGFGERKLICTLCDMWMLVGNLYKAIRDFSDRLQRCDDDSVVWAWEFNDYQLRRACPYLGDDIDFNKDVPVLPEEARKLLIEIACDKLKSPIIEESFQRELEKLEKAIAEEEDCDDD